MKESGRALRFLLFSMSAGLIEMGSFALLKVAAMNRNFIVSAEAAAPLDKKDGELAVYIALNYIF